MVTVTLTKSCSRLNMHVFSRLLPDNVKELLRSKYSKIKTQSSGFNENGSLVKTFNFCLVNENEEFNIN